MDIIQLIYILKKMEYKIFLGQQPIKINQSTVEWFKQNQSVYRYSLVLVDLFVYLQKENFYESVS